MTKSAPGAASAQKPAASAGLAAERSMWMPDPSRWHRPLLWTAGAMGALTLVLAVLAIASPHEITGSNGWFKPIKFTISIALYTATVSWLLGLIPAERKRTWWIGTGTAITMLIEIVIITGAAALGTTSHFNVSTPGHTIAYGVMAFSVLLAWLLMTGTAALVWRLGIPGNDPARTLAVRAGLVLTLIGMGLAFLMTIPMPGHVTGQGVRGAHAIGVADGGPGLWFLGWSTTGGDLRIGHFIGMHALQVLPLLTFFIERAANRIPRLDNARTRARLVGIGAGSYLALMALTTVQALAGEPITSPSAPTLLAGGGLATAAVITTGLALSRPSSGATRVP